MGDVWAVWSLPGLPRGSLGGAIKDVFWIERDFSRMVAERLALCTDWVDELLINGAAAGGGGFAKGANLLIILIG